MGLPIVENLSGPQESIFNLSRGPQLHFGEKITVLKMEFSIVENLSGPQESIFNLSRRPQLHLRKKNQQIIEF